MFNVILKQYYAGVTHADHTCICCYNERLFEFYRLCYHKQLVSANSFFFLTKNNLRCTSKINRWHQNSNRFTMYKVLFWKYIITSYIKLKIRKWERIICIVHVVAPPLSDRQHNIIVLYALHCFEQIEKPPVSRCTNMQWQYKRGHIIYMCFITN